MPRATSPELDAILGQPSPVLDHGFISVVDYMGNDLSIVQAARVSYGTETKSSSEDKALIEYLTRHRHSTPFEMCEIKFHVKLPIFVARQWIRHRTANVNEISARYSILDKEFYVPELSQITSQSQLNKQGRGLPLADAAAIQDTLKQEASLAHEQYASFLEDYDLTRELARINLPLSTYTQWYWKVDLHNLFSFLTLRADPHAQHEIRMYAEKMLDIVAAWCPMAANAFLKYRLNARLFSHEELAVLRAIVSGKELRKEDYSLSAREWREFWDTFKEGI